MLKDNITVENIHDFDVTFFFFLQTAQYNTILLKACEKKKPST